MLTAYSGDVPYAVLSTQDKIFYLSLHSALLKGLKVKVTELAVSTGNKIGQPLLLSSDSEIATEDMLLHVGVNSGVPVLVWTDKTLKTLRINIVGSTSITSVNVPSKYGEFPEKITVHAPRSPVAKPHFLVHYQRKESHCAEVYHVESKAAKKAYDLPELRGKAAFSASSQKSDVFFTRHIKSENILYSSVDPSALSQWKVGRPRGNSEPPELQDVSHAASEVLPRGGSAYAVRSALTSSSGDWKLIRNGETSWLRPEGLAGVVAAAFIEIAKEESLAEELAAESKRGLLAAYSHRVRRHLRGLQHFTDWAQALPNRFIGSFLGEKMLPQDQGLRRDGFGFHKIIIVATEGGRLAALDAGNRGMILWNIQAVAPKSRQKWEVLRIEAEEGTALVRGKRGEFLRVVSHTGEITQYQPQALIPSLKTTVPVLDTSGAKVLIPVKDDGSLGDVPEGNFGRVTVFVSKGDDNILKGWTLGEGRKPVLVWQFEPGIGEIVTKVVARPSHDPVASIGKALGDRNVLYKYLNPNILLITATRRETSTATFYVVDSTSGVVLYSTTHSGIDTDKSVVSTISENWFVYSFYSESRALTQGTTNLDQKMLKGYQLVVSELYESAYPNDRGSLGSSTNSSSVLPVKEKVQGTLDTPHVISQTFLIPGPISSISVTSTLQGITTRSLLCVLPDLNAIISISRAFLEPRRPVGRDPTAAEMEEGLFRYSPLFDFEPKWMLNHKREIMEASDVITSPSLLESTSLVFAFGEIDLFGTRISPIGAFDILGKGFSKLQLVLTVLALTVGTTVVAPFVSSSSAFSLSWSPCSRVLGTKKTDRWNVEGIDLSLQGCRISWCFCCALNVIPSIYRILVFTMDIVSSPGKSWVLTPLFPLFITVHTACELREK